MLYRVPSPVRVILTVTRKAQSVYGDLQPYLVVVYRFPSCKCYWRFPRGIRGFCYSEGTRVREGGGLTAVLHCVLLTVQVTQTVTLKVKSVHGD